MPVQVRCPNSQCQQIANVPDAAIGKSAKCRSCGTTFVLRPIEETTDGAAEVSLSILKEAPPESPKVSPPPTPQSAPTPPPLAAGATIGRFEVRKELGSGAFGTVYLAFDPQLQREIALKVPKRAALSNPRRIERFLREARAAAKLRHPNIVPVYDAGQSGDQHYIASAFVRGEPLGEIIEDGGIDLRRAATIVRSLAEGLAYAHREGVVHRDVKPANVMLDEDGQPLLMDFGLAAELDSIDEFRLPEDEADDRASSHNDSRLTRAGSVMGTPSYMAPEIAKGQRGEAQAASDQYALGVVLYELLTGQTPFEGPPAAVLHQVIHETPPKPSSIRKDLPVDLEAICLKAMARDPEERYVTCAAMADDLRRWMDGEPVRARRLGFVGRTRRLVRQEPKLAILTAGALALIIAGATFMTMTLTAAAQDEADRQAEQAGLSKTQTDEAERKAALAEEERKRRAAADAFDLAKEKTTSGDWNGAWSILNGIPVELRNPAWAILMAKIEGFPEFRRVIQSGPVIALDFDTASRHILQVAQNGDLIVWDVWTTREVRRLPLRRAAEQNFWHAAAMSADARRVATFASPTNQPGFGVPWGGGVIAMPAMPKRDLKDVPRKAEVVIWDEQGKVLRTIPAIEAPLRLAMNRDGSLLAIAGGPHDGQQTLAIWNVDTGERIVATDKVLSVLPGPTFAMAFSPDGKLFAATTIQEGGEIRVWDTSTGEERLLIKDRMAVITHLAFSPDGTRLAAAGGGDRLVGPVRKEKVRSCEPREVTVKVMRDGKEVEEKRTVVYCVEKEVEVRGFHYPRMKTIFRTQCVQQKATRTTQKAVTKMEKYTTYETRHETIKRDGKEETVERKLPVEKVRTITVMVPVQEEYTVAVNKKYPITQMDIDPVVRVWAVDGGALQTTITETGPVTALAWRSDGAVLATATALDDACDGAPDCSDCGGFHGGYGTPTYAVPAPGVTPPVSDARDFSQLLAVLISTCYGYGGPGGDCQPDQAKVSLWDPATGQRLLDLPTSTSPVTSIAFSSDNQHIAAGSASWGGGITLWSIASRYLIANGRGDGPITKLLFSQDNARLASFSNCNNVSRLWVVASGSLVTRLDAGPFMQFLPSSRFLAHVPESMGHYGHGCGPESEVSSLGRWLSRDGADEKHPGDRADVLVYSEDGNRLVAREDMPEMRLVVVNALAGTQVCVLEQSFEAFGALKLQISRDGSRIAALTQPQSLRLPPVKDGDEEQNEFAMTQYAMLWDGQTGKLLARKPDAFATDLSPDGKGWVVATRKNVAPAPPAKAPAAPPKTKVSPKVEPPKVVPIEKVGAIDAPGVLLVSQVDPEPKEAPKAPPPAAPAPKVADDRSPPLPPQVWPAFAPQYELTLFDADGKESKKLPGGDHFRSLAFDPTGRCLIGISADVVKVWNVELGKMLAQHRTNDEHVAVSPDGRFLAIHRPQPIYTPTIRPKELKKIAPAAQTPKRDDDDRLLAMFADPVPPGPAIAAPADVAPALEPPFANMPATNGEHKMMWVTVIDLSTGQPVWNASVRGSGHGGMAFAHDGSRLALGYVDGKAGYIQVWDTKAPANGEPFQYQIVASYAGHHGAVNAVAFSPDGTMLASGGDDRVVKIWKLPAAGKKGPGADGPMIGGAVVVMPAGPAPAPAPPKPRRSFADPTGERKAAEAARALKATVLVLNESGELSTLAADKPLPDAPFGLLGIVLEKATLGGQAELRQLASSKELRELVLSACTLRDDSLAAVRDLSINKLNLQGTHLNDKHIDDIVAANRLEWLSVQWTGRGTDADCDKFAGMSNLKTLVLNDCPLTHKACPSIAKMKNLENLQVTGVQLSGSDFAALRALSKLRVFNLHKANISDSDIEAIKALPLETLNVEYSRVTPACLKWLKEMRTLKTLSIEEKVFSADDVADLRKSLPGCRVVLVN